MSTAYCIHCQKVTILRIAVTQQIAADSEGKPHTRAIINYYCISCGSFIRSDEKQPTLKPQFS